MNKIILICLFGIILLSGCTENIVIKKIHIDCIGVKDDNLTWNSVDKICKEVFPELWEITTTTDFTSICGEVDEICPEEVRRTCELMKYEYGICD